MVLKLAGLLADGMGARMAVQTARHLAVELVEHLVDQMADLKDRLSVGEKARLTAYLSVCKMAGWWAVHWAQKTAH